MAILFGGAEPFRQFWQRALGEQLCEFILNLGHGQCFILFDAFNIPVNSYGNMLRLSVHQTTLFPEQA